MPEKSSCLIITPQKLVLLMMFEGFSGDISVPLTWVTQCFVRCIWKQIISVGKLPRYIKVKNPLTLALFNDMLITRVRLCSDMLKLQQGIEDYFLNIYHFPLE